jgi:hypothetical protein
MRILLSITVVQPLNLLIFAWFNRVAGLRIPALRQQLTVCMRKSKKLELKIQGRIIMLV